jgi:hypothetical protein
VFLFSGSVIARRLGLAFRHRLGCSNLLRLGGLARLWFGA